MIPAPMAEDPAFQELVRSFVNELPGRVAAAHAAAVAGDIERVRTLAHQLKGAGAGYGFPDVSTRAAKLETLAVVGDDPPAIHGAIVALEAACREAAGEATLAIRPR